jgi:NDP-sugar pyrophosphorylase family protein
VNFVSKEMVTIQKVKVVLLAGGLGTRMCEETEYKPKPMVEIDGRPVLWHLMKSLQHYVGDTEIEVGYVQEIPLVKKGKRRHVVSTIGEDFQYLEAAHQIRKPS